MDKRMSQQSAIASLDSMVGKKYRHFKGNVYTVQALGVHSETAEILVIYCDDDGHVWVRPLDMFLSEVDRKKYPDVKQKMRFKEIRKISNQMELLRSGLDQRTIPWRDQSQDGMCPIERTKFMVNGFEWSVIHGYGSYGGFSRFDPDAGLLQVMTRAYNGGDPVGWLTAEQVLKMVDEAQDARP